MRLYVNLDIADLRMNRLRKTNYYILLEQLSIETLSESSLEYFSHFFDAGLFPFFSEEIKRELEELRILSRAFLSDKESFDRASLEYYTHLKARIAQDILYNYDIKFKLREILKRGKFSKKDACEMLARKIVSDLFYGDILSAFYLELDLYLEEIAEGFLSGESSDSIMLAECKRSLRILEETQ